MFATRSNYLESTGILEITQAQTLACTRTDILGLIHRPSRNYPFGARSLTRPSSSGTTRLPIPEVIVVQVQVSFFFLVSFANSWIRAILILETRNEPLLCSRTIGRSEISEKWCNVKIDSHEQLDFKLDLLRNLTDITKLDPVTFRKLCLTIFSRYLPTTLTS